MEPHPVRQQMMDSLRRRYGIERQGVRRFVLAYEVSPLLFVDSRGARFVVRFTGIDAGLSADGFSGRVHEVLEE